MPRLSSPVSRIKPHYDVVVVGSGYGGSIAASRLSRAGRSVCLLERGREFQPGEYPDTALEAAREFQTDLPAGHVGSRTALFDMRVNDDISVFQGCGLGGTSLINANVSLRAETRVFQDPAWPEEIRSNPHALDEGYRLAEEMLRPRPYPDDFPSLPKLDAHARSARLLQAPLRRAPINVTFETGVNHVGVEQKACNLCGDCVTGCNHTAKNTTLMNYLPDARKHGAEIFTSVGVRYLERTRGRWVVHYQLLDSGRESFTDATLFVTADVVVLGAGTLGSTEILLRSREHGLSLSSRLGEHFTGNGDMLGFAYNCDQEICGIGWGELTEELSDSKVGPCITTVIDMREQQDLEDGMVIEEGTIPGAIRGLLSGTMAAAAALVGRDTDRGLVDALKERARQGFGLVAGPYTGAVRNTQTFLVMSHDGTQGRMVLEDDRIRIHWPGAGKWPVFEKVSHNLEKAASALGGTYIRNPMSEFADHALVTVHPLGGCGMADTAERGVVNHKGQVFSGGSGAAVHDGLYVCDGAIIPRSLGVNPLLTISALAERNVALLAMDRGWTIDYRLDGHPVDFADQKPGIHFTETMKGFFAEGARDFQEGWDQGKRDGSSLSFILTVSTDDARAMLEDPRHKGRMVGTVEAPALSHAPLTATDGVFRLFVVNPTQPGVRNMVYSMRLTSTEGRQYRFSGYKVVRDDAGVDLWADTTTLFVVLYRIDGSQETEVGKGILRIQPFDFLKQMNSFKAINCRTVVERLAVIASFGRFFGGALYDTYGSIFARPNAFNVTPVPRKKRALILPAPEVHFMESGDGAQLCLTRYEGGKKGPVVLVPGMGSSTLMFVLDTISVTLAEYLCARGYDVWLFDGRSSPAVRASSTRYTLDDIAQWDIPVAIDQIRALTAAPSVQAIGHCLGAAALQMSLLAGHTSGIRSAILSQFTAHIRAGAVPSGEPKPAAAARPAGSCLHDVCERIRLAWGDIVEHDQLNHATHLALHEMFGSPDPALLAHLGRVFERGGLVDREGNDGYLGDLARLNMPLTFVHGERNRVFLPEGSERTYRELCRQFDPSLYSRRVFAGYGHLDCFIGKDAARDVYPYLTAELNRHNG